MPPGRKSSGQGSGASRAVISLSSPLAAAKSVVGAVIGQMMPRAVTAGVEGFQAWYHQRALVQAYGPYAAPVIGVATSLTLSQAATVVGMATKVIKALKVKGDQPAPAPPQAAPMGVVAEKRWQPGWELIALIIAMLCLKLPTIPRVRVPFTRFATPRIALARWGLVLLGAILARRSVRYALDRARSPIGADWTTPYIAQRLETTHLSSSQMRQVFNDTPVARAKPQTDHTHGESAANRNAGSATGCLVAASLGYVPYQMQMSLSNQRKGHDGDRSFHWAKDLGTAPRGFTFNPAIHAAVLVDVDHYLDMPRLLAEHAGVYLISTFQPTSAGCCTGEYSFRFLADASVEYSVSGGAEYRHRVWNYGSDTILVSASGLLTKSVVAYHIDRKRLDDHHSLLLLSPIGKFTTASCIPARWLLEGRSLERLNPIADKHVVLDVQRPEGRFRSVALLGDHLSVTMPKAQFDAVRAVAVVAKQQVSPATVATNVLPATPIGLPTERLPPGHAAVLTSYLRSVIPFSPPVVYPVSHGFKVIRFGQHDYDAPVPLAPFGSPIIGPSYGFAQSAASDHRCIAGRVEAFHEDDTAEDTIPPVVAGYMAEYVEFLIPVPHVGLPVDDDTVYDHQPRPSQRHKLAQAGVAGDGEAARWSAFVKKECYQKPTDPRNISQGEPSTNLKHSRFMYAFHEGVMAKQEWYAFAKTPRQCAERVVQILMRSAHSVCADGRRFDGHVKRRARLLERIAMMRFFHPSCHADMNEALDKQIALPGRTTEGRRYWSGTGRGSGSLETSDFNSLDSSFIGYMGWRNTTRNGVKLGPREAWAMMGIYGGDDSLEGDVDPEALVTASRILGQDYEAEVFPRGAPDVNFLNRKFGAAAWEGDFNTMSFSARLLSKLYTGPAHLHDALQRFAERASGYYRMDRNSPVIGEICRVAHELLGERTEGELVSWFGKFSAESNWPNDDETGWMLDSFNREIPDFDWARFNGYIMSMLHSRDATLLLRAPLCTSAAPVAEPEPKTSCTVGEQPYIVPPDAPTPAGDKGKEEADPDLAAILDQVPSPAPGELRAASEAVPHVDADGKRAEANTPDIMTEQAKSPKTKTPVDPNHWVTRKQFPKETQYEYLQYLKQWDANRKRVARKLGITLSAPKKGAGQAK